MPLAAAPLRTGTGRPTDLASTATPQFLPSPGDGVVLRIVTLSSYHFGENSSPRIYKPVAHLQHREVGFFGQRHLLGVVGVRVVAVLVQPPLQDLDGVLGQVAPPLPRHGAAVRVAGVVLAAVGAVQARPARQGKAAEAHILLALRPAVRVVGAAGRREALTGTFVLHEFRREDLREAWSEAQRAARAVSAGTRMLPGAKFVHDEVATDNL